MRIEFTETAWEDLTYWIENDNKVVHKIKELLTSVIRTPNEGIGKPEPLKHEFKGCWSRRIDRENRLVYMIVGKRGEDKKCVVLQCRYHYVK